MKHFGIVPISAVIAFALSPAITMAEPPRSVPELWSGFDPRQDPLEVEVIREWKEDGGVYRYVRYMIGSFKGKPARMAAFYGFPEGAKGKLPAVMHMHGGGQRAFLEEVKTYVGRGYAALSVNWGGREMEDAKPGDPNTDWGSVDPTQQNVPGYFNLLPGDKFLVDHESPMNNNWYLLTLGCRRGITFLEQQPEVDAARIGGIAPSKAVADHAVRHGTTYVNHTFTSHLALSASLQPYAGLADHRICEYPVEPKAVALAISSNHILLDANGEVRAPDAPGLGIEVDLDGLTPYLRHVEISIDHERVYTSPDVPHRVSAVV